MVITLPPLRERKEDIPELVEYLLRKHAGEFGIDSPSIQPEAVACLQAQPWPGNVRELENVVRKVLLSAQGYTINSDHVQTALRRTAPSVETSGQTLRQCADGLLAAAQRGKLDDAHHRILEAAEKEIFSRAIELAEGNQARAARWLGVSNLTMRRKLFHFGLRASPDTGDDHPALPGAAT